MVFVLHDISDIPVDMSKLANFVKWKAMTTVCFIMLLIFWILMRLLILPGVIIKSVVNESSILISEIPVDPVYFLTYMTAFKILLFGIFLLHGVWFVILVRIALRLALKGEAHDLSEHKKGEEHNNLQGVNSLVSLADAATIHVVSPRKKPNKMD
jgi:hypothetical protein